jgi:parvulin-like peptidyl-prolyl isomerase
MPKFLLHCLLAASPAWAAFAAPAPLPADTPLVVNKDIVVDAADFEGNMLRIPEKHRSEVRMSYDRVAAIVDNMFISRSLAARARDLGLDKDPAVQKRLLQVQEGVLAGLYIQKVEQEAIPANLDRRARELYEAERSKYTTPEQVYVQHILVNLEGRTRATAIERANKAVEAAKSGEDFLSVATRYSDDPDKKRNGGDLGYSSPTSFVEPVRKAIAGMKAKGEIAGPVESDQGFHILKLIDRKLPVSLPYEAVARGIIDDEQQRLKKQRTEALLRELRSSPSVIVHRENVEKLVLPIDPAMLQRALEGKSTETQ